MTEFGLLKQPTTPFSIAFQGLTFFPHPPTTSPPRPLLGAAQKLFRQLLAIPLEVRAGVPVSFQQLTPLRMLLARFGSDVVTFAGSSALVSVAFSFFSPWLCPCVSYCCFSFVRFWLWFGSGLLLWFLLISVLFSAAVPPPPCSNIGHGVLAGLLVLAIFGNLPLFDRRSKADSSELKRSCLKNHSRQRQHM